MKQKLSKKWRQQAEKQILSLRKVWLESDFLMTKKMSSELFEITHQFQKRCRELGLGHPMIDCGTVKWFDE